MMMCLERVKYQDNRSAGVLLHAVFLCALFFLSACASVSPFSSRPDLGKEYALDGLEDDPSTERYVRGVMDEKLYAPLEIQGNQEKEQVLADREAQASEAINRALRARGYYQASVTMMQKQGDAPPSVVFDIDAGAPAVIGSVAVVPPVYGKYLDEGKLKVGRVLVAQDVLDVQGAIYDAVQKEYCAFSLDVRHRVSLNPNDHKADVTFAVEAGDEVSFGEIQFRGQETLKESYLRKVAAWKEGGCFQKEKIAAMRERLLSTGLFSKVDVILPDAMPVDKKIPVIVDLKERARRSIMAGVSYYTDEGAGAKLGWQHRNFFGGAEKFDAELNVSMLQQDLKLSLSKPYFLRQDQVLSVEADMRREDTDAYEKSGVTLGAGVERKFGRYVSAGVGTDFEISQIEEDNLQSEAFGLVSPNVSVAYDSRDDALDPRKGILAGASVRPFVDAFGNSNPFIKTELSAQSYFDVHEKLVLAGRVKLGSISGSESSDIPASERFYAGGGGSVRGFGYQEIGPVNGNDPSGGRSLSEGAVEARFKVTEKVGGVLFVDAAHVSTETLPEFSNFSIGAGAGVRYYTGFGPLRLDVGVPLTNKENLDQNYQVYISVGQAF